MSYLLSDPFAEYGTLDMEIEPEELVKVKDGLDTSMQVWQTGEEESFIEGGVTPGRPLMRIKEVATKRDGPRFIHRLMSEGFVRPKDKIESSKMRKPEEGWDEGPMSILTLKPENYFNGGQHPLYPSLILLDLEKEDVSALGNVWRINCECRGILQIKAVKRRYSTNGREVTATEAFALPTLAGGDPKRWTSPMQNLQMTERFLMIGQPPTGKIGQVLLGGDVPSDTPIIFTSAVNAFSTTRRWNYPFGWRIDSLTADRLYEGRLEHDVTVQYSYRELSEPGGTI